MQYIPTLILIGTLYLLAAASPGPNFFIISQLALSGEKRLARKVAAGVTLGSTLWACAAMAGLTAALAHLSWLSIALKVAGAVYLVWYGAKLLLGSVRELEQVAQKARASRSATYQTGLLTSLTNPKSGVFWTSVFAATLPANAPLWVYFTIALMIACLSAAWHFGIAALFTATRVQVAYSRARRSIDAVCGVLLISLGLRLGFAR